MNIRLFGLLLMLGALLAACQEDDCAGGATPDPEGNCPIEDESEATP